MRRRWIKLWTQESLYGTTSDELELDEQAVWFKLLALAGDSPEPGKIVVAPEVPLTDEQIAKILKVPLDVWLRTKEKLLDPSIDKIFINQGIIHIRNWGKYQTGFNRTDYMREYMRRRRRTQKEEPEIERDPGFEELAKLLESVLGRPLNYVDAEELKAVYEARQKHQIRYAIEEAARQNKRNWAYIKGILDNL